MPDLSEYTAKLEQELEEVQELQSELSKNKGEVTLTMLGTLVKNLGETIEEMLDSEGKRQYFDKDLGSVIEKAITKVIDDLSSKQTPAPVVNMSPQISVNLDPLKSIAADVVSQNKIVIDLLSKITIPDNSRSNYDELFRLITTMVQKNNAFLERTFKEFDYTGELKSIGENISNRPSEWIANVTKRDDHTGQLRQIIIKSNK